MYIREIILDGFKSYSTRTVVPCFDPSFNAITGLNGSGKSNILDAICFVLGISNLSQVRVSNLQELVYKQGQAGITKATVTIVFDNKDRKQSPVGYEQYEEITVSRQIAIGGKNKYLINGVNAQQSRVQNLFHSVQLNVNNPHFLIMQGRITKVMNMKPQETLSMIEEAAGTRLYELKKIAALKTIEKKQKKVDEITTILAEDITPTLEKLRGEREKYMKWSSNNTECERLQRFVVAYTFTVAERDSKEMGETTKALVKHIDSLKKEMRECDATITKITEEINQQQQQREKELEKGFRATELKHESLSKELVKINANYNHKKDSIEAEEKANTKTNKQIAEAEETITKKITIELPQLEKQLQQAKENYASAAKAVENMQIQIQAISAGVVADSNSDLSLVENLMVVKKKLAENETESKQVEMLAKHALADGKEKEKLLSQVEKQNVTMANEYKKAKEAVEKAGATSPSSASEIESKLKELKVTRATKSKDVEKMQEAVDGMAATMANLDFVYSDPVANFDRSRVKGLVANLVEVKDLKTATALEISAGGRLFNVVVDTEETGKQLLEKGQLKQRVTIIPLNKIASRPISSTTVAAAQDEVGKENARLALSLVGFESEVKQAIEYVFGNVIVCPNMEVAKRITFNKAIGAKTVTLDGDVFESVGTLTGGSKREGGSILLKLQQLNDLRIKLMDGEKMVAAIDKEIKANETALAKCKQAETELNLRQYELKLVEERMEKSEFHILKCQVDEAKKKARELEQKTQDLARTKADLIAKAKDLEEKMKDVEKYKKNQEKEAETRMVKAKKDHGDAQKKMKDCQMQVEQVKMEITELQQEVATLKQTVLATNDSIKAMKAEMAKLFDAQAEKKQEFDKVQKELDALKGKLKDLDDGIADLNNRKEETAKKQGDMVVELKKKEHEAGRCAKEQKDAEKLVASLLSQHKWINIEKQFFGRPHSDFDFQARDPEQAQKRFNDLQEEQASLSKKINKKVMAMFDKAEQDYQDLMSKKTMIEGDKLKIESVIEELDKKKNEALKTTWKKVNRDFGSIFSTLLPGAFARLSPPEGMTVLDGLEVRVAFGEVWKDSLSELSGGQRSLLALSLILALLLFKPAPMYILDEVDAALDLSHTQNIGQMLRAHFQHSQFIVVSLKEGMFNNANVLFRTKFVDGVSTVARIAMGESGGASSSAAAAGAASSKAGNSNKAAANFFAKAGNNNHAKRAKLASAAAAGGDNDDDDDGEVA